MVTVPGATVVEITSAKALLQTIERCGSRLTGLT